MSKDKVFVRSIYSSDSGKVYMVLNHVTIPEFSGLKDFVGDNEGVVLANLHTGDLVVFSYVTFSKKFKKIEEYTFKNQKGIMDIVKGKVK